MDMCSVQEPFFHGFVMSVMIALILLFLASRTAPCATTTAALHALAPLQSLIWEPPCRCSSLGCNEREFLVLEMVVRVNLTTADEGSIAARRVVVVPSVIGRIIGGSNQPVTQQPYLGVRARGGIQRVRDIRCVVHVVAALAMRSMVALVPTAVTHVAEARPVINAVIATPVRLHLLRSSPVARWLSSFKPSRHLG